MNRNKLLRISMYFCLGGLFLLSFSAAYAQVRQEPAGNTLPQPLLSTSSPINAETQLIPGPGMSIQQHDDFADQIDLSSISQLAVFDQGRAKIFDTYAREMLINVYGKSRYKDLFSHKTYDPTFTWLDLLLNKSFYADSPLIYVEVLALRKAMAQFIPEEVEGHFLKWGRLPPSMLLMEETQRILNATASDLRQLKGRNQVLSAWAGFRMLPDTLKLVSPDPEAGSDQWRTLFEENESNTAILEAKLTFMELAKAWNEADANAANTAIRKLTTQLPAIHPQTYPSRTMRYAEFLYNRTQRFTFGYIAYGIATLLLLIAMGTQRKLLIRSGIGFLLLGFVIHTAGFAVRGYISGRWPIHNQFESFIALAWFACLIGIVLMFIKKQWMFGAAAAALGTTALLFANTVEIPSHDVAQVSGILATSRILYVHVNVVIAAYALIALGFFIALFYLGTYYFKTDAAMRMASAGLGDLQQQRGPQALLNDLDKAHLVILQLAFWLLGVGILLGAYWADHAWGRWWGWDPKETWALITWIIYLIVIHIRFGVRKPQLVTAWLSVIGFFVMLWTHWGVNLLLAGLHSYA
jgi:cytochrome c-type biogenesis protein CcsB